MAGIGSQRGDISQKLHATLHTKMLEHGSFGLLRARSKFLMSWTTDLGTERELPRVGDVNLAEVFPFWAEAAGRDADPHDEHAAFRAVPEDHPMPGQLATVNEHAAFAAGDLPDELQTADPDAAWDDAHHEAAAEEATDEPFGDVPNLSMKNLSVYGLALPISGVLHIFSNMTNEVLQKLSHYEWWWPLTNAVASMLIN
eukprot:1553170-Lingulodinium_polyedra.AAC.1